MSMAASLIRALSVTFEFPQEVWVHVQGAEDSLFRGLCDVLLWLWGSASSRFLHFPELKNSKNLFLVTFLRPHRVF